MLDFKNIQSNLNPPPLFERGAPMWNDPYIATHMLKFHLNENVEAASRRPEIIDQIVAWITRRTNLKAGMSLLDLGCGPGLYTKRFADKGMITSGIDYSQNSLDYAKQQDTKTRYIYQNYNDLQLDDQSFDVIMMIYGDLCVLNSEERDNLLVKVHKALKPNGYFVCDVTQPSAHQHLHNLNHWSLEPNGGFWKPDPYLILEHSFLYPEDILVHQYIVIEIDGTQTIYRNWYQDYVPETISPIFKASGYHNISIYGDLTGIPYDPDSHWCGIVAQQ